MAAPTNPFASALEGHQEEDRQAAHIPYNPFVTSTSHNSISANSTSNTNPFTAQQTTVADSATAVPAAHTAPVTHQHESIADQLSGLDFGSTNTSTGPLPSQAGRPLTGDKPSQEPQNYQIKQHSVSTAPPTSSFDQVESQPAAPMATTYAPPPGPPPADPYVNTFAVPPQDSFQPPQQHQAGAGAVVPSQTDADEAYARQLLAEDEARVKRRQKRRGEPRSDGAPAHLAGGDYAAPRRSQNANDEKQWNTKEIYWRGRLQRIIIQNENGPCSLIALCNVLLLRGTLQMTPEDRPAASYSYLASLLGEHLIDVISTSNDASALDLEAALSILPQTQTGLDVNVLFSSITGFTVDEAPEQLATSLADVAQGSSSSASASAAPTNHKRQKQRGELALFKLCNVPLVHGWLADEDDKETWGAVVLRSGDYDKALDRLVAGDELAKGSVVEGGQPGSFAQPFRIDSLLPEEKQLVQDAFLIRNFLEATATQLTYPGLYALSTKLERGVCYALFRNSHLSLLYRPTEDELRQANQDQGHERTDAAQPQLYQLVTDSTLENEDGIVWESVEDVDGSASRFFDGKFRPSKLPRDFIGRREGGNSGDVDEDADFAYAQQLQDQESRRARQHQRNQQQQVPQRRQQRKEEKASSQSGNIISRMLASRKAGKRAPSQSVRAMEADVARGMGGTPTQAPTQIQHAEPESNPFGGMPPNGDRPGNGIYNPSAAGPGPGEEYETGAKKEKWYKKIF